ncbi:hypothetical protein [Brevundimonas sp.]|uniref:hypothetical protein n=1 Tax=Brevundimonas sp. TaxID=1871086 RepID=UPI0035B4E988
MRRTILVLLGAALVAGCQPPTETPEAAPPGVDLPAPEMPADAPPQEEIDPGLPEDLAGRPSPAAATDGSCQSQIGEAAAARLVERCVMVSPATHPPCNVANPCALIQGEIDRACGFYGPDDAKPAECSA